MQSNSGENKYKQIPWPVEGNVKGAFVVKIGKGPWMNPFMSHDAHNGS